MPSSRIPINRRVELIVGQWYADRQAVVINLQHPRPYSFSRWERRISWISPPFTIFLCLLALASIGYILNWHFIPSKKRLDLPYFYVGEDVISTLEEAHEKCPNSPFALSLPGMELAVLPSSEIETIKALPESEVSIKKHHYNVFLGEYTYMGTKADEFDSTMRHVLTRNTPAVLASFTAEVGYAMQQTIGTCERWTAINPREAMSRMASLMSGRAFVGLPLSRDEIWVNATVKFTGDVSRAWLVLRLIPWIIRPFVAPFLSQVKSLKSQVKINEQKLAPVLAAKLDPRASKEKNAPGGDMIDWFISQYRKTPTTSQLSRDQLLATFASIYNLSNALTYIVFDLAAAKLDWVEELRAEVMEVVGESGVINKLNLPKLRKLDSFAKESQRLSPPSLVNIPRIVTNPNGLKLSSGHIIPQGTLTTILSHSINQSPELYEDPSRFDPFRFSNLRKIPGNELKYQHATTGIDNINFGHGIWACPGRFFASAEIKVVLAYLLMHYEMKLKPGEPKPGQQHWGLAILPNPTAEVLFKVRK